MDKFVYSFDTGQGIRSCFGGYFRFQDVFTAADGFHHRPLVHFQRRSRWNSMSIRGGLTRVCVAVIYSRAMVQQSGSRGREVGVRLFVLAGELSDGTGDNVTDLSRPPFSRPRRRIPDRYHRHALDKAVVLHPLATVATNHPGSLDNHKEVCSS